MRPTFVRCLLLITGLIFFTYCDDLLKDEEDKVEKATGSCTGTMPDFGGQETKVCIDYTDQEQKEEGHLKKECTEKGGDSYTDKFEVTWTDSTCDKTGATSVCNVKSDKGEVNWYIYDASLNTILKDYLCKDNMKGEYTELAAASNDNANLN